MERLLLVYKVKLHMYASGSYLTAVSAIRDAFCQENWIAVPGTERLELFQQPEELGSDLAELKLGIDIGHRSQHLISDLLPYELVNPGDEFFQIGLFHGKTGSIDMAAEVLQKVSATLDCLVKVEPSDASGRTGDEAVGFSKDYSGIVEGFDKAGRHYSYDSLVPCRIIDDSRSIS